MCGIVGYVGMQQAYPIVIEGLRKLEYRGYDSAGVCMFGETFHLYKAKGDVNNLVSHIGSAPVEGTMGIGHTRWATHGEPSDVNAHPHLSMFGKFVLVHNGIIENYRVLKDKLETRGYEFRSETDTEVLVNLIEYIYIRGKVSPERAVQLALQKVVGAYGICVMCVDCPGVLIAARLGSPLVVGIGEHEYFVASDATPIAGYTSNVIMLSEGSMAVMSVDNLQLTNLQNELLTPQIQTIDWDVQDAELGTFPHYMLKEIYEQPKSVLDTFRGRIGANHDFVMLGGLYKVLPTLIEAKRIVIVACGTSWHAGLVGEYLLEEVARIPVEVEYASEFRYRNPILGPGDVVMAISQSGETADTLEAVRMAKRIGVPVIGICNVVGSSISRETQAGVYTHAGPELGVASTKAFTTQVTVLSLLSILLGYRRGLLSDAVYYEYIQEILAVPEKITQILQGQSLVEQVARQFYTANNFLYLGRGFFYPVALEGALKLKEISYIHAEGYTAAEMKHGPIALVDEHMPVVVIAGKDKSYEKIVNNVQEIKARRGKIIAIVTEGDEQIRALADYCIEIPAAKPVVECILAVIPLQLLAYHIALLRGCNVDRPRNLAKSVTVE